MSRGPQARLDRLLANLGYGSRSEVQQLVAFGQVLLDGEPVEDWGVRLAVSPELSRRIQVAGAPLDPPPPLSLMLHKPLGVVCSHKESGRSIYELLPPRWRGRNPALSTVGRLDADTTGLILLTDDGALLHKVISPRRHVAKRYHVVLERPLRGGEAERFASGGMMLPGEVKPLAPARLEPLGPAAANLTITEGRYHQVRRMFAAVGNKVAALHRDRVGGLGLPADLPVGAWRILFEAEQSLIFTPAA
jgi:16S rRNA pseudouridine516 synthase